MGQLSGGGLTNVGIVDPNSGSLHWVPKGQAAQSIVQANRGAIQPSTAQYDENGKTTGFSQPDPNFAKVVNPSPQQAASLGATPGGMNATSPALTKGGKLLAFLTSGLQGALAGRAADEQTVAASGGRTSGGAGTGFGAGFTLPWQRASQQLGLEKEQAQIGLLKSQQDMIPTQYGPMPAALARYILPAQIRGEATENAAQTGAQGRVQSAQIGAGARTGAAQIGANARVQAAQMGLGPLAQVPEDLQQQFGLPAQLPLKMLNQAESAANRPLTTVYGENDAYTVNRQTGQKTALGVGNRGAGAVNAGLVPVADPNNPGVVTYERRGNAVGKQSPQGAATAAAKTEARSEVPTKIGDQKVAFNTAIAHADLLKKAFDSVQNGDVQVWNSIKNRAKTEFGWSEQPTARLIAEVYAGEINKIINAGHITQQELDKVGGTVPTDYASPGRMAGALSAYKALAQSKLDNLVKQANAAKGGTSGGKVINYKIVNGQLVAQ